MVKILCISMVLGLLYDVSAANNGQEVLQMEPVSGERNLRMLSGTRRRRKGGNGGKKKQKKGCDGEAHWSTRVKTVGGCDCPGEDLEERCNDGTWEDLSCTDAERHCKPCKYIENGEKTFKQHHESVIGKKCEGREFTIVNNGKSFSYFLENRVENAVKQCRNGEWKDTARCRSSYKSASSCKKTHANGNVQTLSSGQPREWTCDRGFRRNHYQGAEVCVNGEIHLTRPCDEQKCEADGNVYGVDEEWDGSCPEGHTGKKVWKCNRFSTGRPGQPRLMKNACLRMCDGVEHSSYKREECNAETHTGQHSFLCQDGEWVDKGGCKAHPCEVNGKTINHNNVVDRAGTCADINRDNPEKNSWHVNTKGLKRICRFGKVTVADEHKPGGNNRQKNCVPSRCSVEYCRNRNFCNRGVWSSTTMAGNGAQRSNAKRSCPATSNGVCDAFTTNGRVECNYGALSFLDDDLCNRGCGDVAHGWHASKQCDTSRFQPGTWIARRCCDGRYQNSDDYDGCIPLPTSAPTNSPTNAPTDAPTNNPTNSPTKHPTKNPTKNPTRAPTRRPTRRPTRKPTRKPTPRRFRNCGYGYTTPVRYSRYSWGCRYRAWRRQYGRWWLAKWSCRYRGSRGYVYHGRYTYHPSATLRRYCYDGRMGPWRYY